MDKQNERRQKFLRDNPIKGKVMNGTVQRLKNEDLKRMVAEDVIRTYGQHRLPYHVGVEISNMSDEFKEQYKPKYMMGCLWSVSVDADGLEDLVQRKDVLRIVK